MLLRRFFQGTVALFLFGVLVSPVRAAWIDLPVLQAAPGVENPEDEWIWYEHDKAACTSAGGAVEYAINPDTGSMQPFCNMPKKQEVALGGRHEA